MTNFPQWLHDLARISLALGFACATIIAVDEVRRPQKMWIMNLVWPLTALFGSLLWIAGYFRGGRNRPDGANDEESPFPVMVATGSSHCGAGCALGDIMAEWIAFGVPAIAVWFGWHSLFQTKMFAVWLLDFLFAFVIGIFFQYYTIAPMRGLSFKDGVSAALKADALSISAWQVGMYGFMAFAQFAWFGPAYGGIAEVNTPEFWFAMQIAMLCGFVTSYPVNWALIHFGLKEKM